MFSHFRGFPIQLYIRPRRNSQNSVSAVAFDDKRRETGSKGLYGYSHSGPITPREPPALNLNQRIFILITGPNGQEGQLGLPGRSWSNIPSIFCLLFRSFTLDVFEEKTVRRISYQLTIELS